MNLRQETEDRIGTCPACWGGFKVRDDDVDGSWSVVLHGYERPGTGSVIGGCSGTGAEPLEHSRAGLEATLAEIKLWLSKADEGTELMTTLQERLRFAEFELEHWSRRPIPGIDIDPVPFIPRRPPTREEISERLAFGIGLHGDLRKARDSAPKRQSEARPPRLTVILSIPNPFPGRLREIQAAERAL